MSATKSTARARKAPAATGYSDDTGPRFRAYVASLRPLRGCQLIDSAEAAYYRGRSLIERLANNAIDTDPPTLKLSPLQVADVLSFIGFSEPIDENWWRDPENAPSYLAGFSMLMQALEESLRSKVQP